MPSATKYFLQQVGNLVPAMDELDLTLILDFNSSDLNHVIEALAQTNVSFLTLDLKDFEGLR
ncbi:hypothetical protein BGZ50_006094 [Haplosporangium sp. Z 11]|nr:hypothetical protein BGZ50_006094 [Haplosporangium sp. Z 11]